MEVFVNNVSQMVEANTTVEQLLEIVNIDKSKGVAIAVNNQIVPKASWNSHILNENDKITLIRITQGG